MIDLPSSEALAARTAERQAGESKAYRAARTALLAQEYELRRMHERVAAQRRALPPGPQVRADYRFRGEDGEADLAGLFGMHDTLVTYVYMFGPQGGRTRPCPMCTTTVAAWDQAQPSFERNAALAVIARAPIADMLAFKAERGWRNLKLFEDVDGAFARDFHAVGEDDMDYPAYTVFRKEGDAIRLFWADEMSEADPGQDPRGLLDQTPLWMTLDVTPRGRRPDWYPTLDD